ncbi:GGDEF domain-containing protein [Thalassotalea fusca]
MKYHDSIEQADKKSAQAMKQLQQWHLAATPINYAVSYEYVNNKNAKLKKLIEQHLALGKRLDNFLFEDIYQQVILKQNSFRDGIVNDIDQLITTSSESNKHSQSSLNSFVQTLEREAPAIASADQKLISRAVQALQKASRVFKIQQLQISEQLKQSVDKANALKAELDVLKKEIYLDPLTGLYNRKALAKHVEAWIAEDPSKQIAAIVVNVDQLGEINQHFGGLISDVLLSKIAQKVKSYVGDSGLPVRAGNEEFLILLPDVERSIAMEIAEKIRQGVEKLRFVSSKSGVRLPQMTVSLGVNDFTLSQNFKLILNNTRALVTELQKSAHNQVMVAG